MAATATPRTIQHCSMCDSNELHTANRCETCGHQSAIA